MNILLAQSFGEVLGDIAGRIFPSVPALITQLIATGIMFFVVVKFGWKPIKEYITKRQDKMANELSSAQEASSAAQLGLEEASKSLKKAYEDANRIVEDAKVKALNVRDDIVLKAENEAKAKKESAHREIEAEKVMAQKEIRQQMVEVAMQAAQKVVAREINDADNRKLVENFVKDVDDNG